MSVLRNWQVDRVSRLLPLKRLLNDRYKLWGCNIIKRG